MSLFNNLLVANEEVKEIIGLTDELRAIYINNYLSKYKNKTVIVTNTLYEANKLYQVIYNHNKRTSLFPMDDFLTSEALAISPELKITRLETLNSMITNNTDIVITNLMGYLRYLPLRKKFVDSIFSIKVDNDYDIKRLESMLYDLGYESQTIVDKTGTFATRGFVLDVFCVDSTNPVRIEFWGETVESIRYFDIDSQLTIEEIKEFKITPATELLINHQKEEVSYRDFPLYETTTNINDYFDNCKVIFNNFEDIKTSYSFLLEQMLEYSVNNGLSNNTQFMNKLENYVPNNSLFFLNFDKKVDSVENTEIYNSYQIDVPKLDSDGINKLLNNYLKEKKTIILCLSNRYQANKLIDHLNNEKIFFTTEDNVDNKKINVVIKSIQKGFIYKDYVVFSENDLFGKNGSGVSYKTKFKLGSKIRDINKLNIGDYVVHMSYGIGVYAGIKMLIKNNLKKDYLLIQYKGKDKLYIPVERIDLISKYSSADASVPKINKLGSVEWEKTKIKARNKAKDIAFELLNLYASREASKGFAFDKDNDMQIEFENEFIYQETKDQLRVTDEIKKDMEKPYPMDRLLCGDVGFGKTEVAFRAAFKAVLSGKQVALLCPTTILSNQHYLNAIERFKSFPVRIALLNRFVTAKQTTRIVNELEQKKIDIVIGTHKLLGKEIKFNDLGLLIVDEEQRFGVKHKEKIKELKNNIDVLTLSATPIPRTLQMSLAGIRSLSLIETPPVNRYPVETYVLAENKQLIKESILKELSRNGQVFLLYNHVDNMNTKVNEISKLVPDARIASIHGRMDKDKIEDIMIKFNNGEFDVLICTTIIETGIDIPNVNTLIIIDADRFGLSQLYQIRGRVGRSERIAYCYLMYQPGKILTDVAVKRLNVIKEFTQLGSGFSIAMRDLSIRGAGSILGSDQAGFIDIIGIELFMKMLNEEISKLKGLAVLEEETKEPLIDVNTSIDNNYVKEEELKIEIHKKINSIDSLDTLEAIKNEIEDRFGAVDENLLIYMYEELFEKVINKIDIEKINQTKNFIEIVLSKELTEKINGEQLFIETSKISRMFRFSMKSNRLIITLDIIKLEKHFIYYLLDFTNILLQSIKQK